MSEATLEDEAPPPQTIGEQAFRAAVGTLAYRTPDGDPIIPQPEHMESWEQGAQAAIEAFIRLVPEGDPFAFAVSQMWLHQRAMDVQLNLLTTAIAEVRRDTASLVAKMNEYADVLPEPGSLQARAFRWGAKRPGATGG